jgi:hypothetical protein
VPPVGLVSLIESERITLAAGVAAHLDGRADPLTL